MKLATTTKYKPKEGKGQIAHIGCVSNYLDDCMR